MLLKDLPVAALISLNSEGRAFYTPIDFALALDLANCRPLTNSAGLALQHVTIPTERLHRGRKGASVAYDD